MTTGDSSAHLVQVHDADVSRDLVPRVTGRVLEDMKAWQARPLDAVYPVVLVDAITLGVRSGTVANRSVSVSSLGTRTTGGFR